MADIVKGLKNAWMRGMEAIGDTASNIANNTKYKVQEMNLINRRHEILEDFGAQAYALWQQGEKFPDELQKQLEELCRVDETLNTIRAERLAYLQTMEEEKNAARAAADDFRPEEDQPEDDDCPTVDAPEQEMCETPECHAAPVMDVPEEEPACDEAFEEAEIPTLDVPDADEAVEATAAEPVPLEDPIEELMSRQAPATPEAPVKPASAQKSEFEKKVGRALDTVQDKVSKLGRVIDRSVQNLAKVVLQNEEKQDKPDDGNGENNA